VLNKAFIVFAYILRFKRVKDTRRQFEPFIDQGQVKLVLNDVNFDGVNTHINVEVVLELIASNVSSAVLEIEIYF